MSFTESIDTLVAANRNGLLAKHETWQRVRLRDICSVLNGFPFESSRFSNSDGTPLLRIRDVGGSQTSVRYQGAFDPAYIMRRGDLLVGMDGDFWSAVWLGAEALLNQRVCRLKPDERFYSHGFLVRVLQGYLDAVNAHTSSITVKHLSSRTVQDIPLPLPPLAEQARIAAELDTHLSRVDAAIATLERVERNLKRYRASVLKAAVEGRLVPTEAELARSEGRSFEPASELLDRILTERRLRWEQVELDRITAKGKPPTDTAWKSKYLRPAVSDVNWGADLPAGWCLATVDQVTAGDRVSAYGVLVPGPDVAGGVPLVRVGDIAEGAVDGAELKRIARKIADQFRKTYLQGNEVLLTLVGTIGRSAVVPDFLAGANVARAVGVIPISTLILSQWVSVWLRSPVQRARLVAASHEVARKTLNLEDVRSFQVALPPLAEQTRIVAEVARLSSVADAVEGTVSTELARCKRLRQSILKAAFEGKLVDQDPNDEPASVLLERIRAERAAGTEVGMKPKRRTTKRRPA